MPRRSGFGEVSKNAIIGIVIAVIVAAIGIYFLTKKKSMPLISSSGSPSLISSSESPSLISSPESPKIQVANNSLDSSVSASIVANNANVAAAAAASGDIATAQAATAAATTSATAAINSTTVTNNTVATAVSSVGNAAIATAEAAKLAGTALVNIPSSWTYVYGKQYVDINQTNQQYPGLYNISTLFTYPSMYYSVQFFNNNFPPNTAIPYNDSGLGLCTLFNATDGSLRSVYAKNNTPYNSMPIDSAILPSDIYYYCASYIIANGGLSTDKNAALQQIINKLI